jgi:hypothetical protein
MSRIHTSSYQKRSVKLSSVEPRASNPDTTPIATEPSLSPSQPRTTGATPQKSPDEKRSQKADVPAASPVVGIWPIRELWFTQLVKLPDIGTTLALTTDEVNALQESTSHRRSVEKLVVSDEGVVIINGSFRIPISGGSILGWR